jgi:hypothetical protein
MRNGELPEPQYEGEDVRPTSQKELSGWYSYGFAAEVFVICAMGKCEIPSSCGCYLRHIRVEVTDSQSSFLSPNHLGTTSARSRRLAQ